MLIFVILLHFGLKIMSLCAATTASDDPGDARVHICADFNPASHNQTLIKWTVSSPVPVNVTYCELAYYTGQNPVIIENKNTPHTHATISASRGSAWTIYASCQFENANGSSSPSIHFIPGNPSYDHVCSDSGLGSLSSSNETGVVVCIWRSEIDKTKVVVRWQPKEAQPASTLCTLHRDLDGQVLVEHGLPADDFQHCPMQSRKMTAWLTCTTQDANLVSEKVAYIEGGNKVCSEQPPLLTPTPIPSKGPTTTLADPPSQDSPGTHSRLGISNMAMGLALAGGILIGGIIIAVGFIRWFRWQNHRRRERLLRNGDPATEQSAMDEFQQMM